MHTENKIQGNNNASHRGGNTVSLRHSDTASRRDGKENKEKPNCCSHTAGHGTPSNRVASVGRLKPNAENRDAFQLTRNSLDTFHPRVKLCHVCRDFTAARCDHRATGYTWLGNVFKIARACSSHAMRGQTRLLKIKNKFPWKHTKLRAGFNWQS